MAVGDLAVRAEQELPAAKERVEREPQAKEQAAEEQAERAPADRRAREVREEPTLA